MDHERSAPAPRPRNVGVALQGGGSHGAFTWGALDRLLQEPAFAIDSVTGTSAGAMNAVVLADGLARGGAEEARKGLRLFWEAVASIPGLAVFRADGRPFRRGLGSRQFACLHLLRRDESRLVAL